MKDFIAVTNTDTPASATAKEARNRKRLHCRILGYLATTKTTAAFPRVPTTATVPVKIEKIWLLRVAGLLQMSAFLVVEKLRLDSTELFTVTCPLARTNSNGKNRTFELIKNYLKEEKIINRTTELLNFF